ncbi:translation elongation factor Ts [Blattabacterium cuenoti]|uniref:translation elongation factor Ts n=1 Tax=Blattabacterium cuenoti TaxID=1653831 RepID=UPI00163BC875|nr:translation elongation factor Ts [Blattabacterium cuenoti]
MKISSDKVMKLRKRTGVGIMDCKKALIKSNGNFDDAVNFLRKKGKKIAINRSSFEMKEGGVLSSISEDQTFGTIVGLSCETDFLSKSSIFLNFLKELSIHSLFHNNKQEFLSSSIFPYNKSVKDIIHEKISVVGELLELKIFERIDSPFVKDYTHINNKIATLVGFSSKEGIDDSIAKNIAMHITAMNPIAIDENGIPDSLMKKEIDIIRYQVENDKKTNAVISDKIVQGKLNKFILENTLIHQNFIKNNKITVQEYLNGFNKNLKILLYKRRTLSEFSEKKRK